MLTVGASSRCNSQCNSQSSSFHCPSWPKASVATVAVRTCMLARWTYVAHTHDLSLGAWRRARSSGFRSWGGTEYSSYRMQYFSTDLSSVRRRGPPYDSVHKDKCASIGPTIRPIRHAGRPYNEPIAVTCILVSRSVLPPDTQVHADAAEGDHGPRVRGLTVQTWGQPLTPSALFMFDDSRVWTSGLYLV